MMRTHCIARTARRAAVLFVIPFALGVSAPRAFAQGAPLPAPPADAEGGAALPAPPPPAASYAPQELDRIVSPIALYPDPLLAQILTASTFAPEVPPAAKWSDQHHYLAPPALAGAIAEDQLPWQPSVQALLPFPSVLGTMASDMAWTNELGDAFLAAPQPVMDAVQRQRRLAYDYGYLRSNGQILVNAGPAIEILPANPAFITVPYYDPAIVYARPRAGFVVSSGIRFGFGVTLGTAFAPWGWGSTRFVWTDHALFVNNARWGRTWGNRLTYVHPFAGVPHYARRPAVVEHHEAIGRSAQERAAERGGRAAAEEHKREDDRQR